MRLQAIPDCSLGVISDQPAEELPAGAWTDARNVRFKGGVARSMRGIAQVFNAPTVTPYALFPYAQGGSTYWVHCGLAAVYVDDGTTRTDITGTAPTGGIDSR